MTCYVHRMSHEYLLFRNVVISRVGIIRLKLLCHFEYTTVNPIVGPVLHTIPIRNHIIIIVIYYDRLNVIVTSKL